MPDDGCCPVVCAYQPLVVGLLRAARAAALLVLDVAPADGYDLAGLLGDCSGDPSDHERERWAGILADLDRAEAAGCRSDLEISRYLCPLARMLD